ncbi:MAG: tRNA uridine-5-carboxymethylaminomethyl(34) synthesis GTPase MnmE [Bacteroidota bacterium]
MSYSFHDLKDTIVALSTPPGSGAIAVIRLSGNKAFEIVQSSFKGKDLIKQKSHTLHFGEILTEENKALDEVLVGIFKAPNSYTKEDVIEISCHASPYIIQELLGLFVMKGARLARAGEFTQRAYLNGQFDLSQAEAVADLIASESKRSHQLAMHQMRGGVSDEIKKLRQELIDFASLIELELDFGEEDVEFANRDDLKKTVTDILSYINSLIQSFKLGNAIKNGVSTVIAGRPNAGKSTLLNKLLKEDRAIVSDIAGTTRDTIEEVLNINGIKFRLIDTAGIREAQDQIEAIGVEKTLEKIAQSAILLYVFDVIETPPEEVAGDISKLQKEGTELLLIANKMDLNPYAKYEHYEKQLEVDSWQLAKEQFVPISAINDMNIEYLKEKLHQIVANQDLQSNVILSNTRHVEALQKASESLDAVLVGLDTGITSDFVAMDIRQALHFLGEIIGEVSSDDLLGNIFGRFCIGK